MLSYRIQTDHVLCKDKYCMRVGIWRKLEGKKGLRGWVRVRVKVRVRVRVRVEIRVRVRVGTRSKKAVGVIQI